jgi:membrane-associated phospholipid phosphatase
MSVTVPHLTHPRTSRYVDRSRAQASRRKPVQLNAIREVGIVALAIFLYFFVRGLMDSKASLADAHARWLVDVERWLGIFHEPAIQEWTLTHDLLVRVVNAIYIYGHWPVMISTLVWLLWKRRDMFPVYRSALLISGAIGLVVFVTFPMAPPRFLPDLGFVDTVTLHTNAYRVLQPPSFTNQYAAMPSLHVGWNLLMGIAIYSTTRHRFWRAFAIAMPLAMSLATILTANHYILDGIAGSLVALTALAIAWRISAPSPEAEGEMRPAPAAPEALAPREEARATGTGRHDIPGRRRDARPSVI